MWRERLTNIASQAGSASSAYVYNAASQRTRCTEPVSWERIVLLRIVLAVERRKGEKWMEFRDRHGDWDLDAALWLGRRCGRLKLAELGRLAGSMLEANVSRSVREFGEKLAQDRNSSEQLLVWTMQSRKCNKRDLTPRKFHAGHLPEWKAHFVSTQNPHTCRPDFGYL